MKSAVSEKVLFAEALECATPEARAAYLQAACGTDPALRGRLEALLRSADQAGDFLEEPPLNLAAAGEREGSVIGRYRLLEEIGEGGCGVVYMAEQEEPVRRRVALKVIKLGMDSRAVVARFEAERQALALMDHPNIARVLDGGATPTGRPYFVMELVRGVRITDFCEEARLGTEARLRLFVQVCHAVQHAHQKGIIHRDLKPSNILVTVNDGVPVPKVIDFGIAKATGARLTDKTLFTAFHAFIGTPAYTSPEQAEMSSVDVDTRSDIYSLGVLLYELLTGRTPFDGEELLRSGLDELRRTIREAEPLTPSRQVERMNQLRVEGSETCHPSLNSQLIPLSTDLDWIVMKCLEKDRSRRYETANGLAADVQRHLAHEPIVARPPSQLYRFRKFVRRNRTTFAAMTVTALALVTGTGVSLWQAIRAHRGETRANAALAELRASAPVYAEQARRLTALGQFPEALEKLDYALRLDPINLRILQAKANLLQSQFRWSDAITAYREALRLEPSSPALKTNLFLCERLHALEPGRDSRWQDALAGLYQSMSAEGRIESEQRKVADLVLEDSRRRLGGMAVVANRPPEELLRHYPLGLLALEVADTPVTNLAPIQGTPLARLNARDSSLADLQPLRDQPLMSLDLAGSKVTSLEPLRGMRTLRELALDFSEVTTLAPLEGLRISWLSAQSVRLSDLAPLRGMPLQVLRIRGSLVGDLSPLAGSPLEELDGASIPALDFGPLAACPKLKLLDLSHTGLSSLEPLRGLKLTSLRLAHTRVRDLSPLAGMPLLVLDLFGTEATDVSPLRQCRSLQSLVLPQGTRNVADLKDLPGLVRVSYRRDSDGEPAQFADEFWDGLAKKAEASR
jgi:serine/threonine protein kinase